MAVFTAAAVAIGAAVATTTAATVAAAVVATSVAIGVAGLAVTAVGLVTKNEGLLKAGKVMGLIGLAGGLAGGAVGGFGSLASGGGFIEGATQAYTGAANALTEGWNKGVGSFFNAGDAAGVAGQTQIGANQPFVPDAANPGINAAAPSTSVSTPTAADWQAAAVGPPVDGTSAIPGAAPVATAPVTPPTPAPAGVVGPVPPAATPVVPPAAPQASLFTDGIGGMAGTSSGATQGGLLNSVSKLPDWIKYSAMTAGMQGISGAAAGWYQGASAEERLEFDKLMNAQRQGQVEYLNRNNAYAPLLQFTGGK